MIRKVISFYTIPSSKENFLLYCVHILFFFSLPQTASSKGLSDGKWRRERDGVRKKRVTKLHHVREERVRASILLFFLSGKREIPRNSATRGEAPIREFDDKQMEKRHREVEG